MDTDIHQFNKLKDKCAIVLEMNYVFSLPVLSYRKQDVLSILMMVFIVRSENSLWSLDMDHIAVRY